MIVIPYFKIKDNFHKIIKNDLVVGLILLLIFLATNGYIYGWDDQHVEIPLLKSLIDPGLYHGDYYVESLKHNFTSFLYPILAKIISVRQIPSAYLVLYLISRYVLFLFIYKLWECLSKEKLTAFFCTLMVMIIGRVEEFLYRTFSHQEFALALIFVGIYFFYKERFILSALILGIAANFHALYSLFPFLYMSVYLTVYHKRHKRGTLFLTSFVFSICLVPLMIWVLNKNASPNIIHDKNFYSKWIQLYYLACPQNFILYDKTIKEAFSNFKTFFDVTKNYWVLIALLLPNITHNELFKKDVKTKCAIATGFGLMVFSFIFSQIIPVRFIVDLNLVRNAQYILFFLMGYTAILSINVFKKEYWLIAFLFSLLLPFIRFGHYVTCLTAIAMLFLLSFSSSLKNENSIKRQILLVLSFSGMIFAVGGIITILISRRYSHYAYISLWITCFLLALNYAAHFLFKSANVRGALRRLFIIIPFVVFTMNFIYYHKRHIEMEKNAGGFWQMQRNWIDMQKFVKSHLHKNSYILVPYDMEMGGFRIFSERKIVVSYRDCGIVGFDYAAGVEWQKRIKDIEAFKTFVKEPVEEALKNAIIKYKVNYIVFMNYLRPKDNPLLKPVYQNEVFSLYRVVSNPIQ